jgi:threonine dehydrogenase-like Zn-dependent dehydrogenase
MAATWLSHGGHSHAMGAERVVILGPQTLPEEVRAWTEGYGVDAVILATATPDNTPVRQAVAALRDRGRLVVVGNTKVELFWKEAYEKEIAVRYTRSYGPGRYDPAYEYGGSDYQSATSAGPNNGILKRACS